MDVSFPEDLQDLLKICFLEQPAAACHLPHTHAKASGLSYCSIFLCFVFFCFFFSSPFLSCFNFRSPPPVLRTAPAHPCHFRLISPSGFQILWYFWYPSMKMSGQIILLDLSTTFTYFHQAPEKCLLLSKSRTVKVHCTQFYIFYPKFWCLLGNVTTQVTHKSILSPHLKSNQT